MMKVYIGSYFSLNITESDFRPADTVAPLFWCSCMVFLELYSMKGGFDPILCHWGTQSNPMKTICLCRLWSHLIRPSFMGIVFEIYRHWIWEFGTPNPIVLFNGVVFGQIRQKAQTQYKHIYSLPSTPSYLGPKSDGGRKQSYLLFSI